MSPTRILQATSAHAKPARATQVLRLLNRLSRRTVAADVRERLKNDIQMMSRLQETDNDADRRSSRLKIVLLSVDGAGCSSERSELEQLRDILSDCAAVEARAVSPDALASAVQALRAEQPDCVVVAGRAAACLLRSDDFGHIPYLLSMETAAAALELTTPARQMQSSVSEIDRVRQLLWNAQEVFCDGRDAQLAFAPLTRSARIIDAYARRLPRQEVIERMYQPILSELQRQLPGEQLSMLSKA